MLSEAVKEFKTQRVNAIKRCIVGEWAQTLSDEDAEVFNEVLVDYSISTRQLLTVLKTAGAGFSLEAIRKHRNEECPCQV